MPHSARRRAARRPQVCSAGGARDDDVVSLNVGGTSLATRRSTLCSVPGSLLAAMFSGRCARVPAAGA
jgi:hypothetical protein